MKMPRNSPDITCCFSGYRPSKLPWGTNERDPWCMLLKKRLYDVAEALYVSGIRHYICGMAQGSDMYFCEAVFKLRSEKGDITVEAAIHARGRRTAGTRRAATDILKWYRSATMKPL